MNAQKRYDEAVERIKKADEWFKTATREQQEAQADRYRELVVEVGEAEKALKGDTHD